MRDEDLDREWGAVVSAAIRRAGMSQAEVATRVDASQQTVSKWCQGTCFPRKETLRVLLQVVDIDPLDLLHVLGYRRRGEDLALAEDPSLAEEAT